MQPQVMNGGVLAKTIPLSNIAKAYGMENKKMFAVLAEAGIEPAVILPRDRNFFTRRYNEKDLDPDIIRVYASKSRAVSAAKVGPGLAAGHSPAARAKAGETRRRKHQERLQAELRACVKMANDIAKKLAV